MGFAKLNIDCTKIKENIANIQTEIGNKTQVLLVAKANAYGLGAVEICQSLRDHIHYIGVATITEAMHLRNNNIHTPILLLSEPEESDWALISAHDISITVYEKDTIIKLNEHAKKTNAKIKTHLKIDTGMTRLGTHWNNCQETINEWQNSELVKEGVYSHFANSNTTHELNASQLTRFNNETQPLTGLIKHFSNSDSITHIKDAHFNLVRVGLNAYQNSFTLSAPIRQIQTVPKGTPIGYGSTYTTDEACQIAIIGMGYADGLSTQLSNNGYVAIQNDHYPIIGKICMDMFMVKLPKETSISSTDTVIILSPDHRPGMSLEEMATKTQQNPREVMTRLSQRITRQPLT